MFSNPTANDALRDSVAPSGELSKINSMPICNFGSTIIHDELCLCKNCRVFRAQMRRARDIYTRTISLYEVLGLERSNPIIYNGEVYEYGFMTKCCKRYSGWCREELCKYVFSIGKKFCAKG